MKIMYIVEGNHFSVGNFWVELNFKILLESILGDSVGPVHLLVIGLYFEHLRVSQTLSIQYMHNQNCCKFTKTLFQLLG